MSVLDLLRNRGARRLRVLTCGHPALRRRSEPVQAVTPELRQLAGRMVTTLFENEVPGVGLAAPQVGVNVRLVALATHDPAKPVPPEASPGELVLGPRMPLVVVNPQILWFSPQTEVREEGCLSIPEVYGPVERPARIVFRAATLDGEVLQFECGGLLARCLQHEIDHLDGILFTDRLRDEDRAAVADRLAALEKRHRARPAQAARAGAAGGAAGG